ncbi:MAG: chromate efflux transporter [Chloroflexi bacterium]|nr:chromate efflux transporter [Chloroflexota bacterium]
MRVSFKEALLFWVRLGFINFGGPAGQIAIMHRELVERRGWIAEAPFLRALNFCMVLPGPEAQQLATYIGWRLHGVWGGIMAGAWFVLPGAALMLGLSWLAAAQGQVSWVRGLFYGVQPVVIAIVVEAVLRIGRRALGHRALLVFPAAAFVAIYFLKFPFPAIVALAALGGVLWHRWQPHLFGGAGAHAPVPGTNDPRSAGQRAAYPPFSRGLGLVVVFVALWALPVGALWLWRGGASVHVQEARFFTQAAFVTFGGAYAVLSYIADAAVNTYNWLGPAQMVQGLGLAESTPGPLILVTQYVGFLGAWGAPGDLAPLLSGTLGALIVTYVTFLPSFLFIFVGAPYIEALAQNERLQAAFAGVTAAVVGVILNLAVFFATSVLLPPGEGLDVFAAALAAIGFVLLWRFHLPIHAVVGGGALLGLAWTLGRPALGF